MQAIVETLFDAAYLISVITIGASSGNMTQMRETAERGHGNYFNVELTDPNLGGTVGSYMQQDLAEVTLSEIQDGTFASKWITENKSGGRAHFNACREKEASHMLEKVGEELRELYSWNKEDKYSETK